MKLKFYFRDQPWANRVDVHIIGEDSSGKRFRVLPMDMVFEALDPGSDTPPAFSFENELSREFFPALVEGLASSGYKYESSDAGELKATKEHLSDSRKYVSKMLDKILLS